MRLSSIALSLSNVGGKTGGYMQPIFLTKADGTVFVTASGSVIVRGFRYVTTG